MSRFHHIKDPAGNPELEILYSEFRENGFSTPTGAPMNWFSALSERPDIMATTWAMCKGLMLKGQLPATVKQMIIVAISTQNDCPYCRVTHSRALESLNVPQEVIDDITTNLDLSKVPPHQRAILQFALKSSQNPASITDADLKALRDFGLSEGEIIEVAMLAAFTNFINTWSEISAIEVDKV